jgi:RNA polymerase sigma-70 factor (ECF subfamily)
MAQPEPQPERPCPHTDPAEERAAADGALAERLLEDPGSAAADVYERFSSDVNRWVWRLLGGDADHNDVVQQVFVKVLRSAKRLRDPGRLSAWVHAITVNTVYGELRRRDVRRLFQRHYPSAAVHADLVPEVEARDMLVRARTIVEKLPARERIVFMLHYVEGRTLAEIAELCGYSHATAKRRLNDANRRVTALTNKLPGRARQAGPRGDEGPP